jgi:hypothetical protein
MTASFRWRVSLAAMVLIAGVLALRSQGPPRDIIDRPAPMPTDSLPNSDYDAAMVERQRAALNLERQKEMVSDTNKLLKLAQELNYEVAASGTDTLTPDDLHRLAEIEKLARSVKDKMAIAVQPGPAMDASPPVFHPH